MGKKLIPSTFIDNLGSILPVRQGELLSRHTTIRVGGPADVYVVVKDSNQLAQVVALAWEWETPFLILGAGSNLLVGDEGFRGLVIENWASGMDEGKAVLLKSDEACGILRVQSGVPLARLAYMVSRAGWRGLEWAVGIPGTVGGAIVNNAGAHGGCIGDIVHSVQVLGSDGEVCELPGDQLGFGYRTSHFIKLWRSEERLPIILHSQFSLEREVPRILETRIAQYSARRRSSQPSQPSAGSIFKNPLGNYAGWLIEQVGLKGRRLGDAQISGKHANFIVNRGKAKASEVEELIRIVQEKVLQEFGILLETEIEKVGEGFGSPR